MQLSRRHNILLCPQTKWTGKGYSVYALSSASIVSATFLEYYLTHFSQEQSLVKVEASLVIRILIMQMVWKAWISQMGMLLE